MDSFIQERDGPVGSHEEGFDVLHLVWMIAKRWRLITFVTVLFVVAFLIFSFVVRPIYTATVSFLVDQETTASGLFTIRQNDPTMALLLSNAITQYVMDHVNPEMFSKDVKLKTTENNRTLIIRGLIQSEASVVHDDQGLYSLKIRDPYPERAVVIANSYLDALQELSDHMNFEAATRTKEFYQQQMEAQRADLEKAETQLKYQQEATGIVLPTSQTNLELNQIATLRSQLTSLQIQKATLSQQVTADSPEMVRLNAQIARLGGNIETLESNLKSKNANNVPTQNLEIGRLERDVAYHQQLFASLSAQYERARLQESFSIPKVHVVDRAAVPVPKTFPNRVALVSIAVALGIFVGLLLTVAGEFQVRMRRNSKSMETLRAIRREFRLRDS